MDLAVIIVCINEADFLRQTLPRSRRALPDAKFCVVYLNEDSETKAVCEALRIYTTVSMPSSTLTLNGAKHNVSAFVRTAQLRMKEMLKKPVWTIITRPQVILDSNLAALDYALLDKTNVYGSFLEPIQSHTDLLRFQATEPSAAEVRESVPRREFLLSFGAKDFPSWSSSAAEATDEFLGQFTFQYMMQLKLGHLGALYEDEEGRVSKRWEERHRASVVPPVRIAPVHAGATQQREEEKKQHTMFSERESRPKLAQLDPGKKLARMFQATGAPSIDSQGTMATARKEVDEQNIVQPKEGTLVGGTKHFGDARKKANPFQAAKLDTV